MEYFVWNSDPILASFFGVRIYWYGFLFALSLLVGFQIMKFIYQKENQDTAVLDDILIYSTIGIVVGARLGHCFFYDPQYYLSNPLKIFAVWEGGLASHGGGFGVILALYFFTKKQKINFLYLLDRMAIPTALFGFFVRMGNFMNSEIVGLQTQVPWAIVFQRVDDLPRHPVQLYEAFSYLIIFFVLFFVYLFKKAKVASGLLFGMFLTLIFTARIVIEFVKTRQAEYSQDMILSAGQMLSVPFLLAGIILMAVALRSKKTV